MDVERSSAMRQWQVVKILKQAIKYYLMLGAVVFVVSFLSTLMVMIP